MCISTLSMNINLYMLCPLRTWEIMPSTASCSLLLLAILWFLFLFAVLVPPSICTNLSHSFTIFCFSCLWYVLCWILQMFLPYKVPSKFLLIVSSGFFPISFVIETSFLTFSFPDILSIHQSNLISVTSSLFICQEIVQHSLPNIRYHSRTLFF